MTAKGQSITVKREPFRNPYADGMPDTPQIIAAMTQPRRDEVLRRLPATKRAF